MDKLQSIIEMFQSVDTESRLELLLDYAKRLPPLDARFHAARDEGIGGVSECQTPVFLFVELVEESLRIHVDVGEEAPTVRGLLSILAESFDRQPIHSVDKIPADLLSRLGLQGVIRMNRAVGFSAMIGRLNTHIRHAVKARK